MSKLIKNISAEEILDSRGNPTLKVTVSTDAGMGSFSVPSGASTGTYEAVELRDGDKERYGGLGVLKAIDLVEGTIGPALIGIDVTNQKEIDSTMLELDGTRNKSKLGGNSTIGVSIACAKAAATANGIETFDYLKSLASIRSSRPIPYLFLNLINGGKHAHSKLPIQEYHIVPMSDNIDSALEISTEIFRNLREIIESEMSPSYANVGDEGGSTIDIGPTLDIDDISKPLELLGKAVQKSGLLGKIRFAMDVAASSFYSDGRYIIGEKKLSSDDLMSVYNDLILKFNLFSIEDPFQEEDFESFSKLHVDNKSIYVVGDDLSVTNVDRLNIAISKNSINAVIIKPNQVGTLSETLATMELARNNNIECIISHRSGETEDDFIADLAYAFGCFGIKTGAPNRGERVVKYNRLKHIINLNK